MAHPSPLLRAVVADALRTAEDIAVDAVLATPDELAERCRREPPEVIVVGAAFPTEEIVAVLVDVLSRTTRALVLCDEDAAAVATPLLLAGSAGCLVLTDCGAAELVAAVRDIGAGQAVLHPIAAAAVLHQWRATRAAQPPVGETAPALTPREIEVLGTLARGMTSQQIARRLCISPKTVEAHTAAARAKLGARNRAQAIATARRLGILPASAGS